MVICNLINTFFHSRNHFHRLFFNNTDRPSCTSIKILQPTVAFQPALAFIVCPQKRNENSVTALQGDQPITATQIIFTAIPDAFFPVFGETADGIHMVSSRSRGQAFNYAFCFIGKGLSGLTGFFKCFDTDLNLFADLYKFHNMGEAFFTFLNKQSEAAASSWHRFWYPSYG